MTVPFWINRLQCPFVTSEQLACTDKWTVHICPFGINRNLCQGIYSKGNDLEKSLEQNICFLETYWHEVWNQTSSTATSSVSTGFWQILPHMWKDLSDLRFIRLSFFQLSQSWDAAAFKERGNVVFCFLSCVASSSLVCGRWTIARTAENIQVTYRHSESWAHVTSCLLHSSKIKEL